MTPAFVIRCGGSNNRFKTWAFRRKMNKLALLILVLAAVLPVASLDTPQAQPPYGSVVRVYFGTAGYCAVVLSNEQQKNQAINVVITMQPNTVVTMNSVVSVSYWNHNLWTPYWMPATPQQCLAS